MTLLESCLCWGDCCDGRRTGELVVVVVVVMVMVMVMVVMVMVMVRAGYLPHEKLQWRMKLNRLFVCNHIAFGRWRPWHIPIHISSPLLP
jgi:hypothetical protein